MENPTDDLDSAFLAFEAQFQVDKCELKRQMHDQMDMQLELWSSRMMNKFKLMVVNCRKLNSNVNSSNNAVNSTVNSNSMNSNLKSNRNNSNMHNSVTTNMNSKDSNGIANGNPRNVKINIPTPNNQVVSIVPSSSSAFQVWSRNDDDDPMDSIDSVMFDYEDSNGFNGPIPDDDDDDSEESVILCDLEDPQDEDQKPSTSSEQNANNRIKVEKLTQKQKGRSLRRSLRVRKRPLTYSENLHIESDSDSDFITLKGRRDAESIENYRESSTPRYRESSTPRYRERRSYSRIIYINCTQSKCKEKLRSREEYETHMAFHGILPYRCTVQTCGHSFAQHPELATHYRTAHSHLHQLPCHSCGQTYRSLSSLLSHLRSVHEPGEYGCVAPGCPFTSTISQTVSTHYFKTHRAVNRQYTCDFPNCGKQFFANTPLIEHQYLHLEIRPYRCRWPDCDHSTGQRAGLYYHIMNEHFKRDQSLKSRVVDYIGIEPNLVLAKPFVFSVTFNHANNDGNITNV